MLKLFRRAVDHKPGSVQWIIMTLITSFFAASQDIAVDGWRVDVLNDDEQGVGASVATLGYRIGMYLSSAGALLLSAHLPWEQVYLSLAYVVAVGVLASLFSSRLFVFFMTEVSESFLG